MSTQDIDKIDLPEQKADFEAHLQLEGNSKIFLSGIFGIGKTMFVRDFFKDNGNYKVYHIFPVNYQVSNNADIFEYIKYDLLVRLLRDIPSQGLNEFVRRVAKAIGKVGINYLIKVASESNFILKASVDALIDIKEEYLADESDRELAESFMEYQSNLRGSIYEKDSVTKLIQSHFAELKKSNPNLKIVLVVDDLDRVDPEHTFRLLNLFSAHADLENDEKNKFDFDKIIFVGDVYNIESIFKSRYGVTTDFSGYINKFFSHSVYNFENRVKLIHALKSLISSRNDIQIDDIGKNTVLSFVLNALIISKRFSARHFQKLRLIPNKSLLPSRNDYDLTLKIITYLFPGATIDTAFKVMCSFEQILRYVDKNSVKIILLYFKDRADREFIFLPDRSLSTVEKETKDCIKLNSEAEFWEHLVEDLKEYRRANT